MPGRHRAQTTRRSRSAAGATTASRRRLILTSSALLTLSTLTAGAAFASTADDTPSTPTTQTPAVDANLDALREGVPTATAIDTDDALDRNTGTASRSDSRESDESADEARDETRADESENTGGDSDEQEQNSDNSAWNDTVEATAVGPPPAPEVVMPLTEGTYRNTSGYGSRTDPISGGSGMHMGTDFAAPLNTPIHAVADGTVTHVGEGKEGRSSNLIIVEHEIDGVTYETWYVHMFADGLYVSAGQQVKAGDVIAGVGNNGYSTGPHLHFEVHQGGETVEPLGWLANHGAVNPG